MYIKLKKQTKTLKKTLYFIVVVANYIPTLQISKQHILVIRKVPMLIHPVQKNLQNISRTLNIFSSNQTAGCFSAEPTAAAGSWRFAADRRRWSVFAIFRLRWCPCCWWTAAAGRSKSPAASPAAEVAPPALSASAVKSSNLIYLNFVKKISFFSVIWDVSNKS